MSKPSLSSFIFCSIYKIFFKSSPKFTRDQIYAKISNVYFVLSAYLFIELYGTNLCPLWYHGVSDNTEINLLPLKHAHHAGPVSICKEDITKKCTKV